MARFTNQQLEAINRKGKFTILSAAAGSGKTTVLVERVIRLITEQGADISKMLIVTFSRASRADFRRKISDALDKKIKELITNRFGTDGELTKVRANLTKPFQDQIWNAIKTVSEKNALGIVLDKSNNISVLFLEKRYDYTDKVLDLLIKPEGKIPNTKKK